MMAPKDPPTTAMLQMANTTAETRLISNTTIRTVKEVKQPEGKFLDCSSVSKLAVIIIPQLLLLTATVIFAQDV